MDPLALVRPLEASWEAVIDAVLGPMGRPPLASKDVGRLGPKVAELSRAYNAGEAEGRRTPLPLEARVAFSFPRDVPKGAGAVRELVASGALELPRDRPLRIVDLGAGLGAMTWGIVRALAASGGRGVVEALLVDEDPAVLQKAQAIARAAEAALGDVPVALRITTRVASVAAFERDPKVGDQDVVVLGQVLSEMSPNAEPGERVASHATTLRNLASILAPAGSLVVVEPALRERTRHLHAVRDHVLEHAAPGGLGVFAPCLHAQACPVRATAEDWCHEDLPVDLPGWVVPLARAAGLRFQGLTFSYLVLRTDGRRLQAGPVRPSTLRFRAISDRIATKGKVELFICSESGKRERIRRLDRDEAEGVGVSFGDLRRGDVVGITSRPAEGTGDDVLPVDARGRVVPAVTIDVADFRH